MPSLAQARLDAAADALEIAMFTTSPDGEITWWPRGAARCYGFAAQEVVGTPMLSLSAYAADRSREPSLLYVTAHGGHVPAHRSMQLRRDGSTFECFRALSPVVGADGQHMEIAVICQPVDDLEAADPDTTGYRWHPVGEHAASIAHDVNNVLGAVMNFAEFVSVDLGDARTSGAPADWGRLEDDVKRIYHAAERASALSRQLLDFDHQHALEPEPRTSDLNELMSEVAALSTAVGGERVDVDVSGLDPDLWRTSVDVGQIERVLVNLVVNAAQAMPEGGSLRVRTTNVTVEPPDPRDAPGANAPPEPGLVGSAEPGRYVCLAVEDTGPGMTDEVKTHAFEPSFTTKVRGTGLGLATVARIVLEGGGHLRVDSTVGRGTTLSVLLPVNGT